MKYTEYITYNGRTFLYVNIIKRTEAEALEAMQEYRSEWMKNPDLAVIWNFTGTPMSPAMVALGKEIAQEELTFRQKTGALAHPSVIIGASNLGRTVASNIAEADATYYAPDMERGQDWLDKHLK